MNSWRQHEVRVRLDAFQKLFKQVQPAGRGDRRASVHRPRDRCWPHMLSEMSSTTGASLWLDGNCIRGRVADSQAQFGAQRTLTALVQELVITLGSPAARVCGSALQGEATLLSQPNVVAALQAGISSVSFSHHGEPPPSERAAGGGWNFAENRGGSTFSQSVPRECNFHGEGACGTRAYGHRVEPPHGYCSEHAPYQGGKGDSTSGG